MDRPADAVEISAPRHAELLAGQSQGQQIIAGPGGWPKLADPPPPVPIVPAEVSRFQARAALMQAGLLADAEAAVAASGDQLVQLAWSESAVFPRNSPTIATLAPALGLTDEAIDQLFITASRISA
ncbi:MAG: hypothetical protein Q4G25_16215 [Paracoccus sp. (in: a-proteobacteria)]|nr:hypothetical protein [Paracoccus sp. (in: a-proteobacteria)]